jgi:hypothetical protein
MREHRSEQIDGEAMDDVERAIVNEVRRTTGLAELGFKQDENGQLIAEGCRVIFYSSCGEWEVDIVLPNGSAIGFDVAFSAVQGRRTKRPDN